MFRTLYVPLDNSDHANAAADVALRVAAAFGSEVVGSHVYAARLHDYRFKQMEYTLPEEYQDEVELERQRKIHDSLISSGLQLISDSYLDPVQLRCAQLGIPFTPKTFDGKNWEVLVRDIQESRYDLVLMGACGLGQVKETQIGTTVDRVVRRAHADTWVVRHREDRGPLDGPIVVAIDGSPQAFAGLRTAIAIGGRLGLAVEAVAVYDPYLHYVMFNGIVGVLSEKASKVFRFKEQEALHEEIIDTGLAKIYESHLQVARAVAGAEGVELPITLLDGKVFEQVLRYVREREASLLVCGRIGVHSGEDMDIGGNTENMLRLAGCSVLLSSRTYVPPIEVRGEATVTWTPEARARIDRIPCAAQGLARTAVLRWSMERGHSIVSQDIVDRALSDILPPEAVAAIGISRQGGAGPGGGSAPIADALVDVHSCRTCGYTARGVEPVVCPVCGAGRSMFLRVDREALLAAAAAEGDVAEDTTFDDRKIGWSLEARTCLHQMPAGYLRRRIKAKIEKAARVRRLPVIGQDFARPFIEPELGRSADAQPHRTPLDGAAPELIGVATAGGTAGPDQPSGADSAATPVTVALATYTAGGPGGRFVPREASPTVARLRPREAGTTPGYAPPGTAPTTSAPIGATCPVVHDGAAGALEVGAPVEKTPADAKRSSPPGRS
ncbi:MAG TPA: universal stress protein [Candidatus Micrarchaeia archaeon]|nr:universal stress protein [Candidatus Micrarchaeia archaeon]